MKKAIILFLTFIIASCSNQEAIINTLLLKEINNYIDISESKDKMSETYFETDIYLVMFKEKNNNDYIHIFESKYYIKDDLDGYINIRNNKVFFYHSDRAYVDVKLLKNHGLNDIPDENSDEALKIFDSKSWYFIINEKKELKRVMDEDFILD